MNPSEIHLAINHLPVFSTLFGTLVLIAGLLFKKDLLKFTAYIFFILGTLGVFASFASGEEAEELVEDHFQEISHKVIHEHEEVAEGARTVSIITGILSLIALFFNYTKRPLERIFSWLILIGGIAGSIWLFQTAHTGGEIMHKEIRKDFEYSEE